MSKRVLLILFMASSVVGFCQSVAGLNFRHLYDPQNEVDLAMRLVHEKTGLTLYYQILQNGLAATPDYSIAFFRYESYTSKDGSALSGGESQGTSGKVSFPLPDKPWLLVAKVSSQSGSKSWSYSQLMEPKYPVSGYLEGTDGIAFKPYVDLGQPYVVHGNGDNRPLHVYYYKPSFPVASPPYTEKGVHVDRFLFADSSFRITDGQSLTLRSKGLYLVQQDTDSAEGFAFIAMNSAYPKLNKIEDIPDPLIFVSAKEEHDELLAAGNDKAKVDKVILDITRDRERAKKFMRNYFRRIELANTYFTGFKEGWKTDRGMIYVIFGLPDEVTRTGPTEVWYYKNFKERFTFVKTGSVYDPNNFLLQRSTKYAELWFNTVDLWRKSQY